MKPSPTPCRVRKSSLNRVRSSITRDRSASLKVVRMAAVCWASTRRWAIRCRKPLILCRVSRCPAGKEGVAGGVAGAVVLAGATAVGFAGGPAGVVGVSRYARTSPLVIRPPGPVAATLAGSTSFSATSLRTAGESGMLAVAESPWLRPSPDAAGWAAGAEVAVAVWAVAGFPAGSSVPIVAPMATVSPSATATLRTPVTAAGTTLLALSVSSSKSGSPALTTEPSGLSQRERIPSEIDSPTPGTVIGTADMASGLLAARPWTPAPAIVPGLR